LHCMSRRRMQVFYSGRVQGVGFRYQARQVASGYEVTGWEVAARYSTLDLPDGGVLGGEEENWTVGVNWYVNRNVRVSANYVDAKATPNRLGAEDNPSALMGRLQIAF